MVASGMWAILDGIEENDMVNRLDKVEDQVRMFCLRLVLIAFCIWLFVGMLVSSLVAQN